MKKRCSECGAFIFPSPMLYKKRKYVYTNF